MVQLNQLKHSLFCLSREKLRCLRLKAKGVKEGGLLEGYERKVSIPLYKFKCTLEGHRLLPFQSRHAQSLFYFPYI